MPQTIPEASHFQHMQQHHILQKNLLQSRRDQLRNLVGETCRFVFCFCRQTRVNWGHYLKIDFIFTENAVKDWIKKFHRRLFILII